MTYVDPNELHPVPEGERGHVYLQVFALAGFFLLLVLVHLYFTTGVGFPSPLPLLGGRDQFGQEVSEGFTHLDNPNVEPISGARKLQRSEFELHEQRAREADRVGKPRVGTYIR